MDVRRGVRLFPVMMALTLVFMVSVACGEEEEKEPVLIGTLFDYTGDLAAYGPPMGSGADLAAELLNDAGGVLGGPVKALHRDSATSPQRAVDAAQGMLSQTVHRIGAFVGSISSDVTLAVAETTAKTQKIVLISPASRSPALTALDDNDYLFRTTVSDAVQGVVLARLAKELGYRSASALYVNNADGEGLANVFKASFEELGGQVKALVPHEFGQRSYVSELRKATEGDPDVLVAISYPKSARVYLREALEGGFIDTFMFAFMDGTKAQAMFDELGIEQFEGMYGTAPGAPQTTAKTLFEKFYRDRYGHLPTKPFIGETFDAFVLVALAIEKGKANKGPAIRDALRDVANPPGVKVGPGELKRALEMIREGKDIDYEGAAGSQNFDENGDVLNTIEIWKIENGEVTSTGRYETP